MSKAGVAASLADVQQHHVASEFADVSRSSTRRTADNA